MSDARKRLKAEYLERLSRGLAIHESQTNSEIFPASFSFASSGSIVL